MLPKNEIHLKEAKVPRKSLVSRIGDVARTVAEKVESKCITTELFASNIFLILLRIVLRLVTYEKPSSFDDTVEEVYKDFGKCLKERDNTEMFNVFCV